MLSYDGVIRKRLRFKGEPPIPDFVESNETDEQLSDHSAEVGKGDGIEEVAIVESRDDSVAEPGREESEGSKGLTKHAEGSSDVSRGVEEADQEESEDDDRGAEHVDRTDIVAQEPVDTRTEAQKRHDQVAEQREKEILRKAASKSYREQVEDFNKKLAEEPEHYDLFKTSFTK